MTDGPGSHLLVAEQSDTRWLWRISALEPDGGTPRKLLRCERPLGILDLLTSRSGEAIKEAAENFHVQRC